MRNEHPRRMAILNIVGYVHATAEDLQRLDNPLQQLINAKSVVQETVATVGWPVAGAG